ncbi:germin-like protein [Musa troglodytarum]|uniref:Germin-like protein n=1 Tax=Musa troglodytarum TaxID=320322 RepID=A0A9E7G0Z5_9LILI|nr:germin-like protein [Musa troglodytarum]
MAAKILLIALLALASSHALASDPSPLQDFCVADMDSKVRVNGFVCKDPTVVKAEDFFSTGLDKAGDTGKKLGSNVTAVNVNKIVGLNTLGISMVRIDYAPKGLNAPHTHPRATEILTVIEGQLFVGFVTSNSDNGNRLFTKMLKKGDVFVFPEGLIHFQFNPGHTNTVAIGALSSQNPGTITIANAVFGSKPPISDEVLAKAFQITRMAAKTLLLALLAVASSLAMASDPSPLQDFCVADKDSKVLVNGFVCKDPKVVKAEDFFFRGLDKAGDTGKKLGSNMAAKILLISLLAMASSLAMASDPSPLQDFCVADKASKVLVNGFVCKDPMQVTAEDFFAMGLDKAGNTENKVGSMVTAVNVNKLAGLNTLGISMVRIDYAPRGLNPPHTHPRATEILTVIEGQLLVGFVTSNTDNGNRLFTKMLKKGDVFVFPEGLIHFQFNPGHKTVAIGALSSQNPGTITIANAVFGSKPPISDDVLAKAFQVDKKTVDWLQAHLPMAAKILLIALLALASSHALASDPSPLQDFCVADMDSKVRVNGFVCKDPTVVKAEDFFSTGLDKAGDTGKKLGSNVTAVNVNKILGLNTLGISMLFVGFVTSNSDNGNRLFTKMLKKGDVFVFPEGLIHFQFNPGHTNTVAIGALSSQNPGTITIANAVFGSKPPISDEVLAKAFQVDKKTIDWLQAHAGEWVRLQGPQGGESRRLLLQGTRQGWRHRKEARLQCHCRQREQARRTQHPGHLHGSHRLRAQRPQPSPHSPRATEILTVTEGQLFDAFVTSNSDNGNRLFTKMLKKGDVFVFLQGLIHFQFNPGYTNTVAIGALSSQNPGTITIADAVFGSKPPISDEVLAKAFQVDKKTIDWLQAQF